MVTLWNVVLAVFSLYFSVCLSSFGIAGLEAAFEDKQMLKNEQDYEHVIHEEHYKKKT